MGIGPNSVGAIRRGESHVAISWSTVFAQFLRHLNRLIAGAYLPSVLQFCDSFQDAAKERSWRQTEELYQIPTLKQRFGWSLTRIEADAECFSYCLKGRFILIGRPCGALCRSKIGEEENQQADGILLEFAIQTMHGS